MKTKFAAMLAIFLLGCASQFRVVRQEDKFQPNTSTFKGSYISLKALSLFDQSAIEMQPFAVYDEKEKRLTFFLMFIYLADNWAFLESVRFLIDGQIEDFAADSPPSRSVVGGPFTVSENMNISVPEDFFQKIGKAGNLSIRLRGQARDFDVDIGQQKVANLGYFYYAVTKDINKTK